MAYVYCCTKTKTHCEWTIAAQVFAITIGVRIYYLILFAPCLRSSSLLLGFLRLFPVAIGSLLIAILCESTKNEPHLAMIPGRRKMRRTMTDLFMHRERTLVPIGRIRLVMHLRAKDFLISVVLLRRLRYKWITVDGSDSSRTRKRI